MTRIMTTTAIFASLALFAGCRERIEAEDIPADTSDNNGEEDTTGRLELYTESAQAASDVKFVSMDIGMVEVHIADSDVADEFGGEWLVLTQKAGEFDIIEHNPQNYLIASGTAPVSGYDMVRIEILGGTYVNADGDIADVDPPGELGGELEIVTDFCVSPGATTVVDSELRASLVETTSTDWAFDLDAFVDDHGSCQASQ